MQRSWCKTVLGGLILLAFVSGCAAKPYQSDPNKSFALNVMRAAGAMDIKDVSQKELAKKGDKAMPGKIRGNESGLVDTAVATLAGGLLFGAAYGLTGDKAPENYPAILAWMPQEMAATPQEAQEKMAEVIRVAMEKALQDVSLPNGYQAETPHIPLLGGRRLYATLDFQGPGCERKSLSQCGYTIGAGSLPVSSLSPDFAGSQRSWAWTFRHSNPIHIGHYSFGPRLVGQGKVESRFPDYDIYLRMSAYLPEWLYVYLAPSKGVLQVSLGHEQGFFRGFTIFNQGKQFDFLEPSS